MGLAPGGTCGWPDGATRPGCSATATVTSPANTPGRARQTHSASMSNNHSSLAIGQPRFNDASLADTARTHGALAAWQSAFGQQGAHAARQVSGDFAVGLRDDSGRVFLAVDRFAIRTLCYRVVGGELHFAERADALVDGQPEIDAQAIFDYLYFHAIPSPRTIFKGVFRVPPGHCVLFDAGRLTVAPYWVPEFTEPAGDVSFPALKAEFLAVLRSAVAQQLDGSKPACFLSGGTDSSTVAGMIRQAVAGRRPVTRSALPPRVMTRWSLRASPPAILAPSTMNIM